MKIVKHRAFCMSFLYLFFLGMIGCGKNDSNSNPDLATVSYSRVVPLYNNQLIECKVTHALGFNSDTLKINVLNLSSNASVNGARLWIGFYQNRIKKYEDLFFKIDTLLSLQPNEKKTFTYINQAIKAVSDSTSNFFIIDPSQFAWSGVYTGQALFFSADQAHQKNTLTRFFIDSRKSLYAELNAGTDASFVRGLFIDSVQFNGTLLKSDSSAISNIMLSKTTTRYPDSPLYDIKMSFTIQTAFSGFDSVRFYLNRQ